MEIDIPKTKNEPVLPDLVAKGVAFVRTAGMREAPEKLLNEIFREVFFEKFYEEPDERQLDPDLLIEGSQAFSKAERAVLYATRGREKANRKQRQVKTFYGAPYPGLARNSWLRSRSDRVVQDHFLAGPIAQSMRDERSTDEYQTAKLYVDALIGGRSSEIVGQNNADILSAILGVPNNPINQVDSIQRLIDRLGHNRDYYLSLGKTDPIARRIKTDFDLICQIEHLIPRLQWLDILKCFLRVSMSSWILSQMRLTVLVRNWIVAAIDQGEMPDYSQVIDAITGRFRGLFHPTLTPTIEVSRHVEQYSKARVELNILLYSLQPFVASDFLKKQLVVSEEGSQKITIHQLIQVFFEFRNQFLERYGISASQLAVRYGESYKAWTNPFKFGQGKNFDEFLLVLQRKTPNDPDDGYLLTPTGLRSKAMVVFPGPMLLKTMVLLAGRQMAASGEKGKLVLADIENHFCEYGIEFGASAGARPKLINELSELGLLKGSPDAGESAEVTPPYSLG